MTAGTIEALTTAIVAIISAVTSLVVALKAHGKATTALEAVNGASPSPSTPASSS